MFYLIASENYVELINLQDGLNHFFNNDGTVSTWNIRDVSFTDEYKQMCRMIDITEEEYNDILDAKALICLLLFEEQNYP